jgi:hypothetical protein
MTIFDAPPLRPPWKYRRPALFVGSGVVIPAIVIFFLLRFHAEYETTRSVMDSIASGNLPQAYKLWKPGPSYTYEDFLQDWGPNGYYGPVKSYRIDYHLTDKKGSNVEVTLYLSPFQPFPADDDFPKMSKTKQARLWVATKDQSISFPPD